MDTVNLIHCTYSCIMTCKIFTAACFHHNIKDALKYCRSINHKVVNLQQTW